MDKISCIIVDDENYARERLSRMLASFENLQVIAEIGDADLAITQICKLHPNLVFLDIEMPRKSGFQIMEEIKLKNACPTFIFVTAHNQYSIKAIKQAVFDYLIKPIDIEELRQTLDRYELTRNSAKNITELPFLSCLCEREKEILKYVIKGLTSKEIAETLFISKATVDTHRKNILEKTDTSKLSDLIIKVLTTQK